MGSKDIPSADAQQLGKQTAKLREFFTGPPLGFLLASTVWLLLFSHFVHHGKYISSWTAVCLLAAAAAALPFAAFVLWVGAVWKKPPVILAGGVCSVLAIGLCLAHVAVEQTAYISPAKFSDDKRLEISRLIFLVGKVVFIGLWVLVLFAAGYLFTKFRTFTNEDSSQQTWIDSYEDVLQSNGLLRPWDNDEISLNKNCLGRQFASFLAFYAVTEIINLIVLMIYAKEYDIFDENTWMALLIGGCSISLLTHVNTCFGLWVEDEASLLLSSLLYLLSVALAVSGWLTLYHTWDDSYEREKMFVEIMGTGLSASFSIVVAGIYGILNAASVQLFFGRRPKNCSPGQGCLISTTTRGRIKDVKIQ